MNKKLSRRDFLRLAGVTSAGLALSACGVNTVEGLAVTSTPLPPTQTLMPTSTPLPTSTTIPSPMPIPDTLRGYADALGFRIGVVAEGVGPHDEDRMKLIAEQFNQIAITSIGWEVIGQRGENAYSFSIPDGFRRFASGHNLSVMGMHLVYGVDLPDWLRTGNFSRARLIEIMQNHVKRVVGHYKGQVRAFTVVNEATEPSIFWNRHIGREYAELACQAARETDPEAILIYNDYAHETTSLPKSKQVYEAVKALKEKDLVDAVGMQMHIIGNVNGSANLDPRTPPTKEQLLDQMYRYGELGLGVFITELDVDISRLPGTIDERLAKQAEIYSTVVEACLESSGICSDINIWGVNDKETWMGEAALLFSYNQPKPAYFAVLEVFQRFYEQKKSV